MQAFIRAQWERRGLWAWLLSPLSLLVCLLASLKRLAYQRGWAAQSKLQVPVIVVGNLSAGGSGKTPLVAWLAKQLLARGFRPGILCRGYRGTAKHWPQSVHPDSDPGEVGDEAVLLSMLTGCPVAAGPDRFEAGRHLLDRITCDLLISDDGFQHLKLARDIDLLVYDNSHDLPLGNGWCLPSGPLREPASAARAADMHIFHGGTDTPDGYRMLLQTGEIYALGDRRLEQLEKLRRKPLHAVAGIGQPARFFRSLRELDLDIIEHVFDDHHNYRSSDLQFGDEYDLITTEKDAIKLSGMSIGRTVWVLPVVAVLPDSFIDTLLAIAGRIYPEHD